MKIENINEWIYYYFIKDEEALPALISYFEPMVYSTYSLLCTNYTSDLSLDDYKSIANTTLVDCLHKYRFDSPSSFYMYYYMCLKRKFIDSFRSSMHSAFPSYINTVSFDQTVIDGSKIFYRDVIKDEKVIEESEYILEKCTVENCLEQAKNELKEIDYDILKLRFDGHSVKYISELFGVSKQFVYYRLKKIKNWFTSH